MIKRVIQSKALYGRTSFELILKSLPPHEAEKLFKKKRSREEILKYLMVFGGIPKYLEEINLSSSFDRNMNDLCFSENGIMTHEFKRIFYSQFKKPGIYLKIVQCLQDNVLSLEEVSKKVKIKSGGGLQQYLEHLEQAEFIRSYVPIGKSLKSKVKKYKLVDEYLAFYFKFIEPNLKNIEDGTSHKIFENLVKSKWNPWLGFAFEQFCLKNSRRIAQKLGFADEVIDVSPYFEKSDHQFQIDLVFQRSDQVSTLCEIKYWDQPLSTHVIPEVKRKMELFPLPRGHTLETVLISLYGPTPALREAEFFNDFISLEDFFDDE
jgi:AAA+ ATPase superfamily predicted ATPase